MSDDDDEISTAKLYEFRLEDTEDRKLHSLIRSKQNKIFFNPAAAKNNNVINNKKKKMDDEIPKSIDEIEQKVLSAIEDSLNSVKPKKRVPPVPPPPPPPSQGSAEQSPPLAPATTPTIQSVEPIRIAHTYYQRALQQAGTFAQ
jgi:hypothetical protein